MSELRDEIHKRFTLNWLIQGAAQHAGMTSHHLETLMLAVIEQPGWARELLAGLGVAGSEPAN